MLNDCKITTQYIKTLENKIKKLEAENEFLKKDHLTGTYNRHYLDEMIETEYKYKLENKPNWYYNICLVDLNDLHSINRKKGYEFGDAYIMSSIEHIKNILNECKHAYRIYRIGGDEFIIITNPYDTIDLEKLKHENYVVVCDKWYKDQSFKEVINKLDEKLVEIKKRKKGFNFCRNCVLNECSQHTVNKILNDIATDE